jgi:hypothetical protein
MRISIRKYNIHTVYILNVAASHVVIRNLHYDGQIPRNITEGFGPTHRYKIFILYLCINILYLCIGLKTSVIFR